MERIGFIGFTRDQENNFCNKQKLNSKVTESEWKMALGSSWFAGFDNINC